MDNVEGQDEFSSHFAHLVEGLHNAATLAQVHDCLSHPQNELTLLQWRLKYLLSKKQDTCDDPLSHSPEVTWIFHDRETLTLLLASGDVMGNKWTEVLHLLARILQLDSSVKLSGYRKRLAVAIALTFPTPVVSSPSYDGTCIDPIQIFSTFAEWADNGTFSPITNTLNTWLLRYVVACLANDTERHGKTRENIPGDFKCPTKVGEATHSMVPYKKCKSEEVSIHDKAAFYDQKPRTLKLLHEYGAVCEGVSKLGAGISQELGIPACPCTFLWWKESEWVISLGLSNNNTPHLGYQWSSNTRCDYQLLFDKVQKKTENYVISEKFRWSAEFLSDIVLRWDVLDYVVSMCPENIPAWKDWIKLSDQLKSLTCQWTFPTLKSWDLTKNRVVLSSDADVTASVKERSQNLIDGTSSGWYCTQKEGWIELNFHKLCRVEKVEILWWGLSVSKSYEILAAGEDDDFIAVRLQRGEVESPSSGEYNEWSRLNGWSKKTKKIRLVMKDGQLDPWGKGVWIGIRQFNVTGYSVEENHPSERQSETSENQILEWMQEKSKKLISVSPTQSLTTSPFTQISSSVPDCIENVLDGTGSEWYCRDKEGWIELDLAKMCIVSELKIQWWGISVSRQYELHLYGTDDYCTDDITVSKVITKPDFCEHPEVGEYNQWSRLEGWGDMAIKSIRFEFKDGVLDPWGMNVWIGIRQIVVYGKEIEVFTNPSEYIGPKISNDLTDFKSIGIDLLGFRCREDKKNCNTASGTTKNKDAGSGWRIYLGGIGGKRQWQCLL